MMKKLPSHVKDICISLIVLCASFGISLLLQYVFHVREHITTVFVFAVFLISLVTRGYIYGIITSFIGTVAVNYRHKEEVADGRKKNTGIGLSVCATIIKAHGGEITAANAENGGAVFRFTLDTEELDCEE